MYGVTRRTALALVAGWALGCRSGPERRATRRHVRRARRRRYRRLARRREVRREAVLVVYVLPARVEPGDLLEIDSHDYEVVHVDTEGQRVQVIHTDGSTEWVHCVFEGDDEGEWVDE